MLVDAINISLVANHVGPKKTLLAAASAALWGSAVAGSKGKKK